MKPWFGRLVLFSSLYDFILAGLLFFASPQLSIFLNIPIDAFSGALLQALGACLIGFGIALIVSTRDLDRLLIIPVMNLIARIIVCVTFLYYVLVWSLPVLLIIFGIIDGILGILFIFFILLIKDYSFRAALTGHTAQVFKSG